MSIGNLIKTSLYSIKAHKLRVFLTMIGIIIGISSTVAMKSIGDGLSEFIKSSMTGSGSNEYQVSFESNNESFDASMIEYFNEDDINAVSNLDGVTSAKAASYMTASDELDGSLNYSNKATMTSVKAYEKTKLKVAYGKWFNNYNDNKQQIVLNYTTAETLFDKVSDGIGKGVELNGKIYEVIGIAAKGDSIFNMSQYYCFISNANISEENKSLSIDTIKFTINPSYKTKEVFDRVTDLLSKNHLGLEGKYKVKDPSKDVQLLTDIIGGITTFVTAITGIALFVGGVGVMNIMYVSVTERKREIGIRRAIGAKPFIILLQFLFEAIIVTGIGGIIGIIVGALLGKLIGSLIPLEGFKAVLTMKTLISSASVSVLVGIVFGIIPARNASKLDPIKAIYQ